MAEASAAAYEVGDGVLAAHEGFLYRAVVSEVAFSPRGAKYKLAYDGWGRQWDEWREDVLPQTEETLAELQRLKDEAAEAELEREEWRSRKSVGNANAPAVPLPQAARRFLALDCLLRTALGDPLRLPTAGPLNARAALDAFVKSRGNTAADVEFAQGFESYLAAGCQSGHLLYPCEAELDAGRGLIKEPNVRSLASLKSTEEVSAQLGLVHLLRLVVRLPQLLERAGAKLDLLEGVLSRSKDLVEFVVSLGDSFFAADLLAPWAHACAATAS